MPCVNLRIGWRMTKREITDKPAAETENDDVGQQANEGH